MSTALALETGYFGVIREPGSTFPVPDGTESNRWMMVDGKPFVDADGTVYDTVLNNEVLLPGVTKKPVYQSPAETNTGATTAMAASGTDSVI